MASTSNGSRIPAVTRTEHLIEKIRLDIVQNVLPPGERITEEGLALRYGISRTPVREALRTLTRESLLTYVPHTGYLVADVDLDAMDDLYTVRVAIEEQVASRIAVSKPLDTLRELHRFWSATPPEGADPNLVFADEHFHETLAAASGSAIFPDMLCTINRRLHRLRIYDFLSPMRVQRTFQQHSSVLDALLAEDTRLARALLRAHIWESHAFVRAALLRSRQESLVQESLAVEEAS